MRVRFALRVIAEVDDEMHVQDALDRVRAALFTYETGGKGAWNGSHAGVRVTEVESVTIEGALEEADRRAR